VVSLTETLYQDLRLVTDQVGASVLCPYFVPTGISRSERNRHDEAAAPTRSQQVSQAMTDKAVASGRVSAADVARLVFDAVAQQRFYIYSHPQALGNVRERMLAIVDGQQPPNPFAARPEVGQQLRAALRQG
jgi:short-subunit dehydrogenase